MLVRFLDLKPGQCHWPFEGDLFCGMQKEKGIRGPYCAKHEAMAHPVRKRNPLDTNVWRNPPDYPNNLAGKAPHVQTQ